MKERVLSTFAESAAVKQQFAREHADRIVQVVNLMATAFRSLRPCREDFSPAL